MPARLSDLAAPTARGKQQKPKDKCHALQKAAPNRSDRPGHGRKASPEYLQRRGVDLYLDFRIAQLSSGQANIHLGEVEGRILSYRAPLLEQLKTRGARFEDFPSYLDQHLESYRQLPKAERAAQLLQFRRYYFNHTTDPKRLQLYERDAALD